jgi:hypothetical protein
VHYRYVEHAWHCATILEDLSLLGRNESKLFRRFLQNAVTATFSSRFAARVKTEYLGE